ncbi:MAG: glycosyltransferase [bacterium]|jgi:glycosyltransferase involved in cell wall biosynthesis
MLVSVVICTYTMSRLNDLHEAVLSLLQQTYLPLEIIVVVDNNRELYEKLQTDCLHLTLWLSLLV